MQCVTWSCRSIIFDKSCISVQSLYSIPFFFFFSYEYAVICVDIYNQVDMFTVR